MADERHPQVRVKATGELGRIARGNTEAFFMYTHVERYSRTVWVFFEETGEYRAFREAALDYLTD